MRRALVTLLAVGLAVPAALAAPAPRELQCFSPARGCTRAVAVSRPTGIAVSPDGRTVVVRNGVGSLGSLGVFARAPRSGRLRQLECVARNARPCADGRGLETPSAIAFAPGSLVVYVTAENGRSLGVYRRVASGKLVSSGSVSQLSHPQTVAVPHDGRGLYVGGDRLWVLDRALRVVQTLPAPAAAVAVSPDGATVYAGAGGGYHGTLTAYARDPATGLLTPTATVSSPETPGIEQPAQLVADDRGVYAVGAVSGAVTRFDPALHETAIAHGLPRAFGLAATGTRVYVAYRDGIASFTPDLRRLGTARLREATGVAAAGRFVYAVSQARVSVLGG